MTTRIRRCPEEGASAVEYAFMAALIGALIVVVVVVIGRQTREEFCATAQEGSNSGLFVTSPPAGSCP